MDSIKINDDVFPTILAMTEKEQEAGLMNKIWPPPVMTFVYGQPRINKFWMKNTQSPLDIAFCFKNKISSIYYGEPNSLSVIGDNNFSDIVVEFPAGTCEVFGIKAGAAVSIDFSEKSKIKFFMLKNGFSI